MGHEPGDLLRERGPELLLLRQPEQLLIRHRGPKQIRQPRGQGILVDQRMGLARPERFHAFFPENEPRRRQDRDHRLRDAGFKVAVGLRHHALGQTNEPIHRGLVDRTPKRAGRKLPQ